MNKGSLSDVEGERFQFFLLDLPTAPINVYDMEKSYRHTDYFLK